MDHTNCHVSIETKSKTVATPNSRESLFNINGMGCQNCANRVHNALLKQDGVFDVAVDLEMHSAQVRYESGKVNVDKLIAAVSAAGNDGHHNYVATLIA